MYVGTTESPFVTTNLYHTVVSCMGLRTTLISCSYIWTVKTTKYMYSTVISVVFQGEMWSTPTSLKWTCLSEIL